MALSKGQATRQKMINLMYLVFIAMLALNVSTEVLDGFDLVNDNLQLTIQNTSVRNEQIFAEIEESNKKNSKKTEQFYLRAQAVKEKTDSIFNYIDKLKLEIAKKSDGKDADVNNLESRDNLDAASEVMVSPIGGQGKKLKNDIDAYRNAIVSLVKDPNKKKIIENGLSTELSKRAKDAGKKDWVEASFDRMPSIAALTYLSEIQANIKQAEGEALTNLLKEIDFSDFRVNDLSAIIVPESKIVMSGSSYKANIFMAAVDTTQRPKITVNGKEITDGIFQAGTSSPGTYPVKGSITMFDRDNNPMIKEFASEYTVIPPMATIAPLLLDIVYMGIKNPISISVPGIPGNAVSATAQGGRLERDGNNWNAYPTGGAGGKFTINVVANTNGVSRVVATKEFRIKALPDPTAYIEYKDAGGNTKIHKRGALARSILLNTETLKAAISDGVLDIGFTVLSFRTFNIDAMGNSAPELSNGARFSSRQLEQIRRMTRGQYLYISGIKVKGPDGIEREISPMEIRIN